MLHIIYTINGKHNFVYKNWTFEHAENVLKRANASYWEIGIITK